MAYFQYGGKNIFYEEFGQGIPILFLHGNTASSKMFELLMPLYAENFRCILIDFLGNGQSDRVERFSPDLWYEEALQTITLTEYLHCGKVSLVGTSGGAWAAINAALLRPDLFRAVVADSFDGRTLNDHFASNLLAERNAAKADQQARKFYQWCQGNDWETVVDLDTEALLQCAGENRPLLCRPLTELKVPILFLGSRQDEMCRKDMEQEYREMVSLISNQEATIHLFECGGHPAMMTNAKDAAAVICGFLSRI